MSQSFRWPEILDIARREGKVSVEGLAAHFGVTVRTVQRWEADEALPVRRHRHATISSTYAYVDELDAEQMAEYRGTIHSPGKDSPFRDRPIEENLELLEKMKRGEMDETLLLKLPQPSQTRDV